MCRPASLGCQKTLTLPSLTSLERSDEDWSLLFLHWCLLPIYFVLDLCSSWASSHVSRPSCGLLHVKELACQAVFFFVVCIFFFKVVIPVCALALSLCLNLHKEAFGAGVSLWVFVWRCVEGSATASAHSMSSRKTLRWRGLPIAVGLGKLLSCLGWKAPAGLWKKGHDLQISYMFFLSAKRDAIDNVGVLHLAPGPVPAGSCLPHPSCRLACSSGGRMYQGLTLQQ